MALIGYKSAGPPCGGHQATRLRGIMCNPGSSVPCILYTLFSVSRFPVLVSGSLESGFRDPGIMLLSARERTNLPQPGWSQDLGWPQNHHEKSSIFKPVSSAPKVMKTGPKVTQNHEKLILESWEIQFLQKLFFAIPPLPNAWFSNPRHPDSDPQITRKNNLEIVVKRPCLLVQMYPKISLNGSPI